MPPAPRNPPCSAPGSSRRASSHLKIYRTAIFIRRPGSAPDTLDPPETGLMSRPANPAAHASHGRAAPTRSAELGDFTFDRGALRLIAMAPVVGTAGTAAAWVL